MKTGREGGLNLVTVVVRTGEVHATMLGLDVDTTMRLVGEHLVTAINSALVAFSGMFGEMALKMRFMDEHLNISHK